MRMTDLCFLDSVKASKTSLKFVPTAVKVGGRYIVSGGGSMALNITHPSPLDDNRLEYHLHLTPDLLPEREELLLPGPLQEEINIQVSRKWALITLTSSHFQHILNALHFYVNK